MVIKLYSIEEAPQYKVTRSGHIYSTISNKFLKGSLRNNYLCVCLIIRGIKVYKSIHRMVCATFHHNPLNKPCVNHKNCNKTDNRAINLEWCTHKENIHHAIINGIFIPSQNGGHLNHSKVPVIDTKTGIVYTSIRNAAKHINKDESHLSRCLFGKRKNKTTFKLYQP